MLIRNVPIRCRSCSNTVHGKEYPITESSGRKVMHCKWHCTQCGTFNKQGITAILAEPSSNENK